MKRKTNYSDTTMSTMRMRNLLWLSSSEKLQNIININTTLSHSK